MNWTSDINGFKAYMKLERSLSVNSVNAYLSDVDKLLLYLEQSNTNVNPTQISNDHMIGFINWINKIGLGARSQARIISGLKAFFGYLQLEDRIQQDPTELISSPRIGRKLPEVLEIQEINEIIAAIDLSKAEGERNRAIIETLYSCGLRVSELVNLKITFIKGRGFYSSYRKRG